VSEQNVIDLLELFENGKTLGSLIRIPDGFAQVARRLETAVEAKRVGGDTFEQTAGKMTEPFVWAAKMLAQKYDCVIANPPYIGSKGIASMNLAERTIKINSLGHLSGCPFLIPTQIPTKNLFVNVLLHQ
jgi:hypothetical protein